MVSNQNGVTWVCSDSPLRDPKQGDSRKPPDRSDLQAGSLAAAARQPQGDTAYGRRKFIGPKLFLPTAALSWR